WPAATGKRLATGKPGARHGMACLEGLPVAWKAGSAGPRARARAKERARGFAPFAFRGGTRGPGTCLAPGPLLSAPRRRPYAYTRPGKHTAGKTHKARRAAAHGPR